MGDLLRSAAVLAGGEGRRMGYDKALLAADGGQSSLKLLTDSLSVYFPDVFIVRRRGLYEDSRLPRGVRVVYDEIGESGPMTGLASALANCAGGYVFVCACDAAPVLPVYIGLVERRAGAGGFDAVLPRIGGFIQPFWSLYGARLLPCARAAALSGRQSIFRFIENRNTHIIEEADIADAGVPASMFSNRNA